MKLQSKWLILLIFGLLLILITSCTPAPFCAPTYTVTKIADTNDGVCSPGDCSLREAVLNANACTGHHTINLPVGGYELTIDGDDEDLGETGDLDITKDLTINGILPPPSVHGGIERSFHIHSGATVIFDHIWLTGGSAIYGGGLINEGTLTLNSFTCSYNSVSIPLNAMGDAMGGCIFNTGDLTIQGAQFLANTAGYGGAIYNYDSAVITIGNANFTGNEADQNGGAIWNGLNASLTIDGGLYRLNEAGVSGGGIWNHGTLSAENLVIEENQTPGNGGGFFNWAPGAGYFTNTWFTLNSADQGGGLYNNEGMVHLYESGLTANTAATGGGVYNQGPAPPAGLLMKNVTVSDNTAAGGLGGGGIYNNSNFDLRFITVADNSPEGIRIDGGAEIKIRSSALANNGGSNCAGIMPDSLDYNIENDGSCAFSGAHDLAAVDPLLEPLAAYGGMAPSHALAVGSPAIDSGVPDLCIAYDQHGTTRPQGAWCDRGAHEVEGPIGTIRGWTYIDENRNDIFDPGEGTMTGVMLTLTEGPCPGVSDIVTVESMTGGFYEIPGIIPGDYCLATSPLQQTLYPENRDLTIVGGDILENINFRYLLSPLGDSSINGLVWHDLCAVPYATPTTPPPGCIFLPGGGLGADGIYDPAEPGIEGVRVELHSGVCPPGPGPTIAGIVFTDINGEYSLPGVAAGTWCATVDDLTPPNDTILIPGNWTYPVRDVTPAVSEVVLGSSEDLNDINFGWDYQYLPEAVESLRYFCTVNQDAFLRTGPSSSEYTTVTGFLKGHLFEVLAISGPDRPGYYYGQDEALIKGWMAKYLLDCINLDEGMLGIKKSPKVQILDESPEPVESPEPLECSSNLNQEQCTAAGGTWEIPSAVTSASEPYCLCPK